MELVGKLANLLNHVFLISAGMKTLVNTCWGKAETDRKKVTWKVSFFSEVMPLKVNLKTRKMPEFRYPKPCQEEEMPLCNKALFV